MSKKHARVLKALRKESEALFQINREIVALGGEPIPPRVGHPFGSKLPAITMRETTKEAR